MRRRLIGLFFVLNLIGGLLRYAAPPPAGEVRLWDLSMALSRVTACTPETFVLQPQPAACARLPPYLPLAFPVLAWLAALPWSVVEAVWYLGIGGLLLAVFSHEARAWAEDLRVTPRALQSRALVAVFASLVFFKGTSLGFLAGQPTVVVSLLLYAFVQLEGSGGDGTPSSGTDISVAMRRAPRTALPLDAGRWAASLCLALAASKPNIAAPFFVYLALRRDVPLLAAAVALTAGIHVAAGFLWMGLWSSLAILVRGPELVASHPTNLVQQMGASGRVDLEPLLAMLVAAPALRVFALAAFAITGLAALARLSGRLDARRLLLAVNAVFVAVLYHRDYDLLLIVLIALPLVRERAHRVGALALAMALPLVLPLQYLNAGGMQAMPSLAAVWNLVGCSTSLAVPALTVWLLRDDGEDR